MGVPQVQSGKPKLALGEEYSHQLEGQSSEHIVEDDGLMVDNGVMVDMDAPLVRKLRLKQDLILIPLLSIAYLFK